MNRQSRRSFSSWLELPLKKWFASCLRSITVSRQPIRNRSACSRKPINEIDILENRLAPAVLTNAAPGVLLVNLNNVNEQLQIRSDGATYHLISTNNFEGSGAVFTGYGSTSGDLTPTLVTRLDITDNNTGTSVIFNNSGVDSYAPLFNINLDNAGAGPVTFDGTSQFNNGLTARVLENGIIGNVGSDIVVGVPFSSAADLSLQSTNGEITLNNLNVTGATSMDAEAITLQSFSSFGTFNGAATTLVSRGVLGITSTVASINAIGPITFDATGGPINVLNDNNFESSVSLRTDLANNATVFSGGDLTLGDVEMESGNLNVHATGNIEQLSTGGGIQTRLNDVITGGNVTFTVDSSGTDITLDASSNRMRGTVTVAGGSVVNVAIRNAATNASIPDTSGCPNLTNYTLYFDNNGMVVPAISISAPTGTLSFTAGGPITQTGQISVSSADFNILGNYGITLPLSNNIFGLVSFNNPDADGTGFANVSFNNGTFINLAESHLGMGTFTITAAADISQSGPIIQRPGAGAASFTNSSSNVINLFGFANNFSGPISFVGGSLDNVQLENVNTLPHFPSFPSLPSDSAYSGTLNLKYDAAPIVLPAFTGIGNLTVDALGILQQPGTAIKVSGTGLASFTAHDFAIALDNTDNNFNPVNEFKQLTLNNSGPNFVDVSDSSGITFVGASHLGSGPVTITAGGDILETAGGVVTQDANAGAVSFSSKSGGISLGNNNAFTGKIQFSTTGANDVSLNNSSQDLILGDSSIGRDLFVSATTGGASIRQAPGTVLTVGQNLHATADGDIRLDNQRNSLGILIPGQPEPIIFPQSFNGSIDLRNDGGPIKLSGVSALNGHLNVTAAGNITQSDVIVAGDAKFNAGANTITLNMPGNDFTGAVFLTSTGDVQLSDANDLNLGEMTVGGALTITAGGDINENGGTGIITQTSAGIITLNLTNPAHNIIMDTTDNKILGPITFTGATPANVTVFNEGNITLTNAPMSGDLTLNATGIVTLPASALSVNSFSSTAQQTTVLAGITANNGDISFAGKVLFNTALSLVASAAPSTIRFNGDVTVMGALTLKPDATGSVLIGGGTWNQGSNPLIIWGSLFGIGLTAPSNTVFAMTSGDIAMPDQGNVWVTQDSTFAIGGAGGGHEVTITNGNGGVLLAATLQVGLGATNDKLRVNGAGGVTIHPEAILSGTGLATGTATPVLETIGGTISGFFHKTVDTNNGNAPVDFLMGSDIVTPAYTPTALTIKQGGTESTTGTVTGFQSDSDMYKVTASTGAAAKLVVIRDVEGDVDVVVRNAPAAMTLTITTTKSAGDGLTTMGGIAITGPGNVTIAAGTVDLTGNVLTQPLTPGATRGGLTSLALHNMTDGVIDAGGATTLATTITGAEFHNVDININSSLKTLTLAQLGGSTSEVRAFNFGTITISGSMIARLTNNSTSGLALTKATIGGQLSGDWDLKGGVGNATLVPLPTAVTAAITNHWNLGVKGGPGAVNSGGLGRVTGLSLGEVHNVSIFTTQRVDALTATSWTGSYERVEAGSIGTINIKGNAATGEVGQLNSVLFIISGNNGGAAKQALTSMSVAGTLTGTDFVILNGNVGTITVNRSIEDSSINLTPSSTAGAITTLQAARWSGGALNAKSVGTFKLIGNTAAQLFGELSNVNVHLFGLPGSTAVTLGTFSAAGTVDHSPFVIDDGSLTTFTVGYRLESTPISLLGLLGGKIGTIKAGEWTDSDVTALSIGTLSVTGVAQISFGEALIGDMSGSSVNAFRATGSAAAIGTFSVAGNLDLSNGDYIRADQGITTFTVGREVTGGNGSVISVGDFLGGVDAVGRIGALTAGVWDSVDVLASSIGTFKVKGYTAIEEGPTNLHSGDVANSTIVVNARTQVLTPLVGIGTFSVSGSMGNCTVDAFFGATTVSVAGFVDHSVVAADLPFSNNSRIATLTLGSVEHSSIRANALGAMTVTRDFTQSDLTVTNGTGTTLIAANSITISGGMAQATINVPRTVTALTANAGITDGSTVAAGYAGTATVGTLSAATIADSFLTARAVTTFKVTGNSASHIVGNVDNSVITLTANAGGTAKVALGTFTAAGSVQDSTFNITAGNVTSFTAGRFLSSDLLVGFHMPKATDITATPAGIDWLGTFTVSTFKTTSIFSSSDVANTASFRDSNVVAAKLGTITLSGIDPLTNADDPVTFGVAFRATGGAAGVLTITGSPPNPKAAPYQDGKFRYLGLSG